MLKSETKWCSIADAEKIRRQPGTHEAPYEKKIEGTPKGAPRLAKCHAKATRDVDASKLTNQHPQEKLM